ncbi:MAG TPA: SRPBCC domain-containing protein [Ktedonobacteraceae bacterium]
MIPPASHNSTTLVLRRTFTATRPRVFRAWISPVALERWLRPAGMSLTVRSLEACVGGSFRFEAEDGSYIVGTYLQVAPPEKLVFTWLRESADSRETIITVDFLDQGPLTEIVLTHTGLSTTEQHILLANGWSSLLNALASLLSATHLDT